MIRRNGYGFIPRTFFHGYAVMNAEETICTVKLYVTYSELLGGAFLCMVFLAESYISVVLGFMVVWVCHYVSIKKNIPSEIARFVFAQNTLRSAGRVALESEAPPEK